MADPLVDKYGDLLCFLRTQAVRSLNARERRKYAAEVQFISDDGRLRDRLGRKGFNLDTLEVEFRILQTSDTYPPTLLDAVHYLEDNFWQLQFPHDNNPLADYGNGGNSRMPTTGQTLKTGSHRNNK